MDSLTVLVYLCIVLLAGIVCITLSNFLKISKSILLVIGGVLLTTITYKGFPLVSFPDMFFIALSTFALVLIVFDLLSRFKLTGFDSSYLDALKLFLVFFLLNLIILTFAVKFAFNLSSIAIAAIFSVLITGVDSTAITPIIKSSGSKVAKILEAESVISSSIAIFVAFVLFGIMKIAGSVPEGQNIAQSISPFAQHIIAGIGAGILIGIIAASILKKRFSETMSPLILIASALIAFVLAESLGGNGVLSVAVAGLVFGSFHLKGKDHLLEVSSLFTGSLEIFVYIFAGIAVSIPITPNFLIVSFALFVLMIIIRFIAINIAFGKEHSRNEKIFLTLCAPNGLAAAVAVFAIFAELIKPFSALQHAAEIHTMLSLVIAFIIYSTITAMITARFSGDLLRKGG